MTEQPTPEIVSRQASAMTAGKLEDWIDATRALARRGGVAGVVTELTAIIAHAGRRGARVAIVSATARSRSQLVNQLLGRQLLPADPGADVPVLITAGGEDRMEAETESGWSLGSVGPDGRWWHIGEPPALAFRLQIAHNGPAEPGLSDTDAAGITSAADECGPLAELGIELISIPLPAEAPRDPTDVRWAAVASADAVIMLVQATAPMTRTETAFLEELLSSGAAASRVLVQVARMDLVEEDERSGLLDHVRGRALAISPHLVVLPGQSHAGGKPESAEPIRGWIADVVLSDPMPTRTEQLARQLTGCLRQIIATATAARAVAAEEQARRAEETAVAAVAQANELRAFDEIRENVRSRHTAVLSQFLQERERFGTRLSRTLLHQLDQSPDPASWWEKDLPYQVETQFPDWDQRVRLVLQERVNTHVQALDSEINSAFGLQPRRMAALTVPEATMPTPGELPIKSLRKRRILYRTSPTGAALVAVLAIPAIGPIAALTASLVGTGLAEIKLRSLADQQRAVIMKRLPSVLDDVLNTYGDQVCAALDPIYQHQEDEVGRLRESWQARASAPSAVAEAASHWSAIRTDCEDLIDKILAGVGAGMGRPVDTEMGAER
jgi:hypothetical protein